MRAKAAAFRAAFEQHFPASKTYGERAEAIYLITGGIPRKNQLAAVAAIAGVTTLEGVAYNAWSETFTTEAIRQKALVFSDVIPALDELKQAYLAISSSMPQRDLERTLEQYPEITGRFNAIYGRDDAGTFHKGVPHLKRISEQSGAAISDIVFIGDAVEDVRRGKEAGAITVVRLPQNNRQLEEQLRATEPDYLITSFVDLLKFI